MITDDTILAPEEEPEDSTALPPIPEAEPEAEPEPETEPTPEPTPEPEEIAEEEEVEEKEEEEEEELPPIQTAMPMPTQAQAQAFEREQKQQLTPMHDRQKKQYWDQIMTGDPLRIPDDIQEQAGLDDGEMDEEEKEQQLLSTVNRSWVVDHLNKNKQDVRQNWENIRSTLAKKYGVGDNEQELFYALSDEQMEGQRRQIANKIHQQSFEAGLRGDIVANTRSEMAELSDAERPRAIAIQQEAFRAGRQKHESMLPMAQQIAEGLPALVNTERDLLSPLSIDQKMKPLLEIKDELAALPKSERDYVYHLALQERQKMDDAAPAEGELDELSKAWRAFRRSSFNIGMDIGQGGAYVAAATLENMGDYLDKPLGSDLKGRSHRIDQRAQVLQELRDLAQLKSYPLIHEEDASLGEKIAHDVASSIPHALLAMSGGVGFGSLLFGGAGASIAEARQRAPEGEVNPQVAAGLIAGAAQAGITMAMGRIGSRVLEQSLSRFASAKGLGFKGYSLAALQTGASVSAESANMLLAGKLAQATDLGLHELAAQCQDTASNINWKAYGDNATDIELNIREAAANLPFLLIASGRMSLRQFRGKREILAQGDALRAWGIPEGKVQKLLKMRDIDQQSEALRIALRDSPRFGGSSVITFAMKTLRLLHQDKFKIFEQPEVVADFLQLPATHSYLKKQPARLVDASDKSSRNKLEKSYQQGKSPTLTEQGMALQLWDYWWQKANIIVPPSKRQPMNYDKRMERLENSYGRFRVHNYPTELQSSDGLIPNKLKRTGFIYRDAEQARRTVLSDRCDDIESLSYQYLLTSTSPSTLPQQGTDINKHIELGEKKRRQVLGRVAQCVMSMALGTPKEQAFAEFEQKFFRHYRNRKDPSREPEWLRGNKLPAYKILKTINTTDRDKLAAKGYPLEHYQAARICMGMESASQTLYHLLPMMDDFGACIARGMTPAQSYRHLLGRELGIDAKDFKPLPQEASDDAPLPSPDSQYLDKLKLLTGEEPEMQLGDAGQELWRMPTHLGQYTRWHSDKKAAIREYAWRMQQAFRPLMEEQNTTLRQLAAKPHFDREKDLPHEALQEFTGFDQLCIQALNDMHDMGSGLRASLLPGMVMGTSKLRNRHRKGAETKQYSLLQFKPEYLRNKDGHFYRADFKSMGTPYSLSRGRAHIYWRRLLDTHLLEPADAFSLLLTAGVVKESERSSLQELAPPTIVPMPAYGRKPQLTVKRDLINRTESRNEALAERLAELSADFQVAHINESTLPPSAKEWYRLIPFCPKEVDAPESYAINQLDSGRKLLRWINKTTANQLNERTDTWQHLRELDSQLRQHPLALHLQESVGHSSAESYHRAWAQQMGGHQAIDSPYTELWHLLTKPLEVWDKMDPERKADLAPLLEAQYQSKLRHSGKDANCPLDWESALLNLDAVLLDYPHIASYAEAIGHKGMVSRMTTLQDSLKQENTINYGSNLPLAWRGRGKPKTSQRISEPMALPAEMRDDPRVMPAIRLMDTMRAFIAHRPQDTPDGISWMGKLYGVGHRHLPQTDETWKPRRALEPLIRLFDDIKQQVGDDAGSITVADVKFTPLPEGMDYQALMHTGIYRNPNAPNEILRLMPGDFTASLLDARTPYVVRSRNGNYFDQRRAIRDVDELHKGIVNLDQHRLRMLQEHADATQESISTTMAKHLTAQILKLAPDNKDSASPSDEIINNSELLMRLAEDSGLCYELESKGLEQLTPPQLSLLSIIQDLMLIEYGPQPEQAYQRLCGKAKGIARSERLTRRLELCILDMQTRMAKIAQGINHQHPNKID